MRYRRAVEKLQTLAEACESVKHWPPDDPFLVEAYVFGRLLTGEDPLDTVEVVLMLNLPPEEVTWGSNPKGTAWLADTLRLSKGGFTYWWRSHLDPQAKCAEHPKPRARAADYLTQPAPGVSVQTLAWQGLANRIVRGLLRTPLVCRLAGNRLITVYVVGRTSGRHYNIPVA